MFRRLGFGDMNKKLQARKRKKQDCPCNDAPQATRTQYCVSCFRGCNFLVSVISWDIQYGPAEYAQRLNKLKFVKYQKYNDLIIEKKNETKLKNASTNKLKVNQ